MDNHKSSEDRCKSPNKITTNNLSILCKGELKYDSVRNELIFLGGHRNKIIDIFQTQIVTLISIHMRSKIQTMMNSF